MSHCTCNNCVAFGPSKTAWCLLRLYEALTPEWHLSPFSREFDDMWQLMKDIGGQRDGE